MDAFVERKSATGDQREATKNCPQKESEEEKFGKGRKPKGRTRRKQVRGGGTVRNILEVGPRFPFNSLKLNSGKVWVWWPPGTCPLEQWE